MRHHQRKGCIRILLWPVWALFHLVALILGLTGRFVGLVLGLVFMLVGVIATLTIIGAVVGIPLFIVGFILFLSCIF